MYIQHLLSLTGVNFNDERTLHNPDKYSEKTTEKAAVTRNVRKCQDLLDNETTKKGQNVEKSAGVLRRFVVIQCKSSVTIDFKIYSSSKTTRCQHAFQKDIIPEQFFF